MKKTILFLSVALPITACGSKLDETYSANDVYLQCKGDISIFNINDPYTVDKQEIAAHIKSEKINFSGNGLLLGENIQICTPSADQPYFDSESCESKAKNDKKRKYGTYNKITGALDLTNLISENNVVSMSGHFKCTKVESLMK